MGTKGFCVILNVTFQVFLAVTTKIVPKVSLIFTRGFQQVPMYFLCHEVVEKVKKTLQSIDLSKWGISMR